LREHKPRRGCIDQAQVDEALATGDYLIATGRDALRLIADRDELWRLRLQAAGACVFKRRNLRTGNSNIG